MHGYFDLEMENLSVGDLKKYLSGTNRIRMRMFFVQALHKNRLLYLVQQKKDLSKFFFSTFT